MGKKTHRRAGPNSDRRSSLVETSDHRHVDSVETPTSQERKRTITLFLVFIIFPAISAIVYRRIYSPYTATVPNLPDVYRRGLVKTDVYYREVLAVRALRFIFFFQGHSALQLCYLKRLSFD